MTGPRAETRARVLADIRYVARTQLAAEGPAGLSLRSIARELGMVSSGIYRYVESRDHLLTLLITSSYAELADAVEAASAPRTNAATRWVRAWKAMRDFALARPHEWALLYGTPVRGYAAPQDTVEPAVRVYAALAAPLGAHARASTPAAPRSLAGDADATLAALGVGVDRATALRFLGAVAQLVGLISMELFGHMTGVVTDRDAFFDWNARAAAAELRLAARTVR